jgi:predicted ribonuclease toxin of YeeF-YezG toxin-antitoxin module
MLLSQENMISNRFTIPALSLKNYNPRTKSNAPDINNPEIVTLHHSFEKSRPYTINETLKQNFDEYMNDIKKCTGRSVSEKQQELLKDYIDHNPISRLSKSDCAEHRRDFSEKRADIRREWAFNNREEWPKYEKDVVINGKIERNKGFSYDAHHIIENSYAGPNEWWNMTPATFPEQHQQGIHRPNGVASRIFDSHRKN